MSPTPPCSAAKATFRPSGEMSGDSGSSTVLMSIRWSMLRLRMFCRMSVRDFSLRTKYATRSPVGDHDTQGTMLNRMPGVMMNSNPLSWSKPLVRLRTTEPSLADTRMMSSSRSLRLPVATAIKSPEGDGSAVTTALNGDFSGSGARLRP